MSRFTLVLITCVAFFNSTSAQVRPVIPQIRKIFHETIDKSQKSIDMLDRKQDKFFNASSDQEINQQINYTLFSKVDRLQDQIELDSSLPANEKIKYLRGINEALASYEAAYKLRLLKGDQLPEVVDGFLELMELEKKNETITPVITAMDYEVGNLLIKCIPFQRSVGIAESREVLLLKNAQNHPDRIMSILNANPNASFADSLIKVAAYNDPENIYTYAQSNTPLGKRINKLEDPLIKTVSSLANMNEGRMYFPFLDNLYRGKVTKEEIDKNRTDMFKYYRLLVNTQIDYAERLRRRDTPMAMGALTSMLRQKAIEEFVNVINGLHEEPNNVRFRKLESLNAQELYYLCVMAETEIYTSSYLNVYERIFQRMKNPNSDTLLMSVGFDHFKKFIKMAANYNTLDNFLKRMDNGNAEILMRAFAGGLEKTASLEDAVDVADSYASISDDKLRKLILDEVRENLGQQTRDVNKRGLAIYELLNTIFSSLDTASNVDLSEKFGIPSIYSVDNQALRNEGGKIIIQQFFYGDKDGITYFPSFVSQYRTQGWKVVNKPEWVEVSSTTGVPVIIYANKPLDEKQGLDEKAQEDLEEYLAQRKQSPTIVIHRGHSYHVMSTIKQLATSAKVVFLGSCGGYQNINGVLNICPYAHIIASKQVGTASVNDPLIRSISETLRQGKDLNWPEMWKTLGRQLKDNNLFEDYVPPYKNLGALFIMAYNKEMEG
jgi:hypothetical protein